MNLLTSMDSLKMKNDINRRSKAFTNPPRTSART